MGQAAAAKVSQMGAVEACRRGIILTEDEGGGTGVQASVKIKHLTSAAYTLLEADDNYMLVFDVAAPVVITLPKIDAAKDEKPITVLAVNTLGPIELVTAAGEALQAYAPHAEQNATIGLLRGSVKWYATGTNIKPEEA